MLEPMLEDGDDFEGLCQILIRTVSQAIWETDSNGIAVADSPSWREYTGQTREEWIGSRWLDAVYSDDRAEAEKTWRDAAARKASFSVEVRLRNAGDGWRWTNILATPVIDRGGRLRRWLGMGIDISRRKHMELDLKEREARHAFLVELTDTTRTLLETEQIQQAVSEKLGRKLDADYVYFCDISEANSTAVIKPGYAAAGLPLLSGRFPLAELAESTEALRQNRSLIIGDTAAARPLPEPARRGYARLGIGALIAVPFVRNGQLLWTFNAACRTPRVWQPGEIDLMEESSWRACEAIERGRTMEELRSSEERYRAVYEFIDEGFCIMERLDEPSGPPPAGGSGPPPAGGSGPAPDFRVISVNAAYARQTGIENAVGRTLREIFPGETEELLRIYNQILDTGQPARFEYTFHSSRRILDLYAFRIREKSRDHVAAVFADITNRKRWETALRESEQRALSYVKRLEKADQNKNRFLSTLSHELRNPLAAIVMSFSVLEQAPPGSEQASHAREVIIRQTTQMRRLVDDLLDVTRISQNKIKLRKETVELIELVRKVVADYRKIYTDKGISLTTDIADTPLLLSADPARLTQIIGNLLHNAQKFTDTGGSVRVTVRNDRAAGRALIEIADSGIGMSPELLRELFQPFTQAEASYDRTQGGLGLGLVVVKGMVEQHGGTVFAASEGPGKGSTFTVCLPLLQTPAEAADRQPEAPARTPGSLKAVVIEDNPDLQEILLQLLIMLGHQAEGAGDGRTGIEKARKMVPDVVLCDIGLPDLNGYEVAGIIRSESALAGVFLVALSGYAQPEDIERSRQAGFDRHLAKPIDLETLKQVLSEAKGPNA